MKSGEHGIADGEDFGPRDLLVLLFKFKYRMMAAFLLVTAVLASQLVLQRPVFEAKSTLLIKIGREFRTDVNGSRQLMISQEGINNSEIQILTSQDSIRKVIERIKVQNLYPELVAAPPPADRLESAVRIFTDNLEVREVKNSNVIEISFRHHNPRTAAVAVNTMVEIFKEKHLEVFSDKDSSFIENQLGEYQSKLRDSEQTLHKFEEKNGIVAQDEQVQLLLERASEIDDEKMEAENRIAELTGRLPVLQSRTKKALSLAAHKTGDRQKEAELKLVNLQLEEQQLLTKYTPSSPMVQSLRKEIDALKAFLKEEEGRNRNGTAEADPDYRSAEVDLQNAQTELLSQKAKLTSLQRERQNIAQRIQKLEQSGKAVQNLKREHSIDQNNYQEFVRRAEDARISKNMDRLKLANVSVVQKAAIPTVPVEPRVAKVLLRALALGVVAGLGLVIASEFLSQGLSTPQALERRLGLRVLLSINKQ